MSSLGSVKRLKNILPYILTLVIVGGMVLTAEMSGEGKIIFPRNSGTCNRIFGCTKAKLES